MPRIRSIKYEFFVNEELASIDPMARLLFIGLWTIADKAGRLEDRPARIKAQLFPYETADVDSLLNELQTCGVLTRYIVDGKGYIYIINFEKHQKPHPKEADSTYPAVKSREKKRQGREKVSTNREKDSTSSVVSCTSFPSVSGNGLGEGKGASDIGTETADADAPPLSDHSRLMKELHDQTGAIVDGAIQGKAAKWLLAHGHTADECIACLTDLVAELKDPSCWRDSRVSWVTVEKEIGSWKLRGTGAIRNKGRPSNVDIGMSALKRKQEQEAMEARNA